MRFIIIFADGTTKHIGETERAMVLSALAAGRGFVLNGEFYAHHSVSRVTTVAGWYKSKYRKASADGEFFCRYGHHHKSIADCACREAKMEPLIPLGEWKELIARRKNPEFTPIQRVVRGELVDRSEVEGFLQEQRDESDAKLLGFSK